MAFAGRAASRSASRRARRSCNDIAEASAPRSASGVVASAVAASREVLGVFNPGEHGSTFGGSPLAAAVAREAISVIKDEKLVERSRDLGSYFMGELQKMGSPHIEEIRGKGLFIGVVLRDEAGPARPFCEQLMEKGLLCKETHEMVIRFAPPLVITRDELDWALERIRRVLG